MFSRLPPAAATVLSLLLLPVQAEPSLAPRLLHRLYHPSLAAAPFAERATLQLSRSGPATTASLVPSETFAHELYNYAAIADGLKGALYQVALEHPGDTEETQWATSSVLACHLPSSTSEQFVLHLDPSGTPFSLDYFLGPVPHDGACPRKGRKASAGAGARSSPAQFTPIGNTTVVVRSPTVPPLPALRTPPPVTAEGKPVEPPREKSFFEKYWMYIAIALLALTLAPAAPEEEAGGRGRGSGGR